MRSCQRAPIRQRSVRGVQSTPTEAQGCHRRVYSFNSNPHGRGSTSAVRGRGRGMGSARGRATVRGRPKGRGRGRGRSSCVSEMEMLFCSTVVRLPFLIPPVIVTGELFRVWNSCSQHLYAYAVADAGILLRRLNYTFSMNFSVTTARKAVTLLLLFLIFTKPLTEQHGTGLLLVAMGIVLNLYLITKFQSKLRFPCKNFSEGRKLACR
ncbi:uncharacterized protein LOC130753447 isoform X2 [Actinidia eriantha]|uniref:uncharacterized protein LOC130753447 isoform X2 n=1 Tax=Actinidia eriantha TaxID=165200 RepID=UPI00258EDCF4|nr:uncharacterized protein LOC130753447 isoform X2 [Actinidia eriantha]